jgi:hypothetical protein
MDPIQKILKNILFFNQACGLKDIANDVKTIRNRLNIKSDIPTSLVGLYYEFCYNSPQYYWKREIASEIEKVLDTFLKDVVEPFNIGFEKSSIEFFESIRAFENITSTITEIRDTSFEEGYKTKLLRNPLYTKICEDFLMNEYRLLKNIINEYSDKDYSGLNTLGKVIPCLKKYGFDKATQINTDLRNAVNHGNVFVEGSKVNYRFGKSANTYEYNEITIWEYDRIIDESYDIACGILVGILNVLTKHPELIVNHYSTSESNAFEWYRLTYRTPKLNVLYFTKVSGNISQLSIHTKTTIENRDNLFFALIELARGAFFRFPCYDSYFVGYEHNRSLPGFIRLKREHLEATDDIGELGRSIASSGNILISDILDQNVNENAYKFHIFPKIKSEYFEVIDVADISIDEFKRIKANVILSKKHSKSNVRSIINKVISQLVKFETPQNPYYNTKFGNVDCDIVLLNVFSHNDDRNKFNLFPNNSSFVCLAHYYGNDKCPHLDHGGVMESLWKVYKKEKMDKIEIAWNPQY